MEDERLMQVLRDALASIAPETRGAALDPEQPLREQVDLDSMDWLRFLLALHERLQVDIPEADYRRLGSLDQLLAYLGSKADSGSAS